MNTLTKVTNERREDLGVVTKWVIESEFSDPVPSDSQIMKSSPTQTAPLPPEAPNVPAYPKPKKSGASKHSKPNER